MSDQKILFWPDTHIPKEDKRKVNIMFDIVKEWQPDYVVLLGDLVDLEAPSRFTQGTPEEWSERLAVTTDVPGRDFLKRLRELVPDAKIDYFEGNHEARLTDYVAKNAPALDGLVTVPKLLDLDNLGIDWHLYKDPPLRILGSKNYGYWYAHHGSYVSKHSGDSARKEFEAYGVSGFSAHTHRLGPYRKKFMDRAVEWWECGHLSDPVKQDYNQWHNWQHGFVYALEHNGRVMPTECAFRGNMVYFDGRLFA